MTDTGLSSNPNADDLNCDVLIIGAGLAGLSTALALPQHLQVMVLSKAELETCSSHYAQGGIAASLSKGDSVRDHVSDTLIAGAGLCATDNTHSILNAGQQAVQWLCDQGVPFTHTLHKDNAESSLLPQLTTADLHLTKEGGHGRRRVAHADDATGRHIMQTLIAKAQAAANIRVLPFIEAIALLTSDKESLNRECQGAKVFDHNRQRTMTIHARTVVLASGGLGQLFARASAPNVCVGDGVMMAWQAGCRLANLEFVQFHPTGLALDDSNFLISEALRGEGGHLYCPITAKRFMLDIDERAELAPRDIVARAIAEQIATNGLGYVNLDVSHLPSDFIKAHFPQIYQTLLNLGIDITCRPIPVAPTAHYSCGGVVTCDKGLTDVRGLYAVGEVAYTGLHGANRLASNSLLECIVVGRQIAEHLPIYLSDHLGEDSWMPPHLADSNLKSQTVCLPNATPSQDSNGDDAAALSFDTVSFDTVICDTVSFDKDNHGIDIKQMTAKLKGLMSSHLGIMRHAAALEQALAQLQQWQHLLNKIRSTDKIKQKPNANDNPIGDQSLPVFQLQRQLQLATLIVHSAYQRCESRGGHFRSDYPDLASQPFISIIEPISNSQSMSRLDISRNHLRAITMNKITQESFQNLAAV